MILLLPFIRRFSIRTRTIIGAAVTAVALVLFALGASVDSNLNGSGVISAIVGLMFLVSALYDHRHPAEARR